MMPHDNIGKLQAMQWLLRCYQPTNKRMLMLANRLAVGGESVLFTDIVLEAVPFLTFVVQPPGQISKAATAKGFGKIACQVCNMFPVLLSGLDDRFWFKF